MTKTTKKTETAVKTTEAVKAPVAETVKTPAPVAEKAAAPKAEKKPTAKKTAKTAAKKATKTAAKTTKAKAATKTATKAASTVKVFVEYQGKQMDMDAILEAVKAAAGVKSVKSLEVYVKPEDGAAYYVVNGKDSGKAAL